MQFEQAIQQFASQPVTQSILMNLLKEYKWPHNKVRDLEKRGLLTPVKRGLYMAGPAVKGSRPSLYLLANHIYGPSYVSMEAALSFWSLIPEKVTSLSSMTTGSARIFRTPVGRFSYIKARLPYYSFGIRQVEVSEQQTVLLASPEKAICDMITARAGVQLRSPVQTVAFLTEDLRIEKSSLIGLDTEAIRSWAQYAPKKNSILMLTKTLDRL